MPDDRALLLDELSDAFVRKAEQRVQRVAIEGLPFRGALHLDEAPVARLHDVHVHFGARVVLVGQVEQRLAVDDADADGGDRVGQRNRADDVARAQRLERERQRDERAGDRRRARAAVGLDHVAVDPDRALTERRQVRRPSAASGR